MTRNSSFSTAPNERLAGLLISRRWNFLFVHVPRTAGISLTRALEPYADQPERTAFRRFVSKLPIRQVPGQLTPPIHASALWARLRLGENSYRTLHSFAIVRHPYDRAISQYEFIRQRTAHHRHAIVRDLSFEQYVDYLASKPRRRLSRQVDHIADHHGTVIVDRLLRFEKLAEDFAALCGHLGLPETPGLPHRNRAPRSPAEIYLSSDGLRQAVHELYRDDFLILGFQP